MQTVLSSVQYVALITSYEYAESKKKKNIYIKKPFVKLNTYWLTWENMPSHLTLQRLQLSFILF